MDDRRGLLPIGRFSRLTGLTQRALRLYDELGLLRPRLVAEETGYRFYGPDQLGTGETIAALRRLELPLEEIAVVVRADDAALLRETLAAHRRRVAERAAATDRILSELDAIVEGRRNLVPEPADVLYEVKREELPDQDVVSVRERVAQDELAAFIETTLAELRGHLAESAIPAAGDAFAICPFPDADGIVAVEVAVPVAGDMPSEGRIERREVPGCTAFVLTYSDPPAELAHAYRALAHWVERYDLPSAGDPREYYAGPGSPTRIAWPVELEPGWEPSSELFEEPLPAPPSPMPR